MLGTAVITRRNFIASSLAATASASGLVTATGGARPVLAAGRRPLITHGIASGDVASTTGGAGAVIWSRADRTARMMVEYATSDKFTDAVRVQGSLAGPDTGFTARAALSRLPRDQHIFYRVWFEDPSDAKVAGRAMVGRLRTPPSVGRDILFAWSGDQIGGGWGINPQWGGLKIFDRIRRANPDFFIHSGDRIYADKPLRKKKKGRRADFSEFVWHNLVTPAKAKVAETLEDYRGNYQYNLLDPHYLRFNAEVPMCVQWDDHEVKGNWYPGQIIDDPRYGEKRIDVLAARARRAFFEYSPINIAVAAQARIYRGFSYGPMLDVFVLDCRSYRGANGRNLQDRSGPATALLGNDQIAWLKRGLATSRATWKVIACDMPIGLRQGKKNHAEAWANGDDGGPLGREWEIADLLRFIKLQGIKNVVWLTAQVHFAAANHYHPGRAAFTDFDPFWEFIAGPLHTHLGKGNKKRRDRTFGLEVVYSNADGIKHPPIDGHQNFGTVAIDGRTRVMTVGFTDLAGNSLFSMNLEPEPRHRTK